MQFELTGLPDQPIFRDAFACGWAKYKTLFFGEERHAAAQFARGPVAMARLIAAHGGETRYVPAAACLAGPALFCDKPSEKTDRRLLDFAVTLRGLKDLVPIQLREAIATQTGDVRLFFQASAILMMEYLADPVMARRFAGTDKKRAYADALQLFSAARGAVDAYHLDTRFEIAAMKVTIDMADSQHLWSAPKPAANAGL